MAMSDSSSTTGLGGAIAALAISSSVVILALSSDKLSSLFFRRGFPHHQHCLLSSSSSSSAEEHCRDDEGFEPQSSDGSAPSSLTPLPRPALALTPFKERKERTSSKRVRFSPDVIDPAGNGQEYRRRMLRSKMPLNLKEEEEEEEEEEETDEEEFIQRCRKHEVQINPNCRKEGFRTFSSRPPTDSCRKYMPNLPANRMALYTGMLRSRTEMRALYH